MFSCPPWPPLKNFVLKEDAQQLIKHVLPAMGVPRCRCNFSGACSQFLHIALCVGQDLSNVLAPERGDGGGGVRACTWAAPPCSLH